MKKLLSLILACAMVFGMTTVAFAAASGKITDAAKPLDTHKSNDYVTMIPGKNKTVAFPLTADMFTWSGTAGAAGEAITTSQLKSNSVTVRYTGEDKGAFKKVSLENLTSSAAGGKSTAHVVVTFAEELVNTSAVEFKVNLYLAVNGSRKEKSRITFQGTLENEEIRVNSSESYMNMGPGRVLVPSGSVRDIELYLGSGVSITTNLYSGRKYYGSADDAIKESDDAMLRKFPDIQHIITLSTVNLSNVGKNVILDYDNMYVYDASGNYLGSSNSKVSYSNKYYLTSRQVDMSGSGTAASGSETSTGNSGTTSGSTTTGSTTGSTATASGSITTANATTLMQGAVSTAKAGGSSTATVRVKNTASVSKEALQAMATAASGMSCKLNADIMSGNTVTGRLTVNPALATNLASGAVVNLGVYVDSNHTSATKTRFNKFYKNNLTIVSMAQAGSYGMTVTVAAKVDLSGMSTTNLYFYSYDKAANKYTRITNPSYRVDSSGYLHFNTTLGGDIVVTDGALALK